MSTTFGHPNFIRLLVLKGFCLLTALHGQNPCSFFLALSFWGSQQSLSMWWNSVSTSRLNPPGNQIGCRAENPVKPDASPQPRGRAASASFFGICCSGPCQRSTTGKDRRRRLPLCLISVSRRSVSRSFGMASLLSALFVTLCLVGDQERAMATCTRRMHPGACRRSSGSCAYYSYAEAALVPEPMGSPGSHEAAGAQGVASLARVVGAHGPTTPAESHEPMGRGKRSRASAHVVATGACWGVVAHEVVGAHGGAGPMSAPEPLASAQPRSLWSTCGRRRPWGRRDHEVVGGPLESPQPARSSKRMVPRGRRRPWGVARGHGAAPIHGVVGAHRVAGAPGPWSRRSHGVVTAHAPQ